VSYTNFDGPLDGAIFANLLELNYLEMGHNKYSSDFPEELAMLPNIKAVYAVDTNLTGTLEFIEFMKEIYELWIDDNPMLGGTLPTEMGRLTKLASLSLSDCDLSGTIPSEFL
jgi:hypothetical protein